MLLSIDTYTIIHNLGMHDVLMRRVGLHKNANLPQQEKFFFFYSHFRNQAKIFLGMLCCWIVLCTLEYESSLKILNCPSIA
jgi:hypothetical protein